MIWNLVNVGELDAGDFHFDIKNASFTVLTTFFVVSFKCLINITIANQVVQVMFIQHSTLG